MMHERKQGEPSPWLNGLCLTIASEHCWLASTKLIDYSIWLNGESQKQKQPRRCERHGLRGRTNDVKFN
jgi:hypothetical protein